MTLSEVKAGQLIELEDYNGRYRVKVVEVSNKGEIRGHYRALAVDHGGSRWEEFDGGVMSLGCFNEPRNIKLSNSKTL